MKKWIFTLLVLSSLHVFAQQQKWQLGVHFSPDYNDIILNRSKADAQTIAYHDASRGSAGFSTGILINRQLNKRWVIETGLTFILQKEVIKDLVYNHEGMRYIMAPTNYSSSSIRTNYLVAIPLNSLYFINDGKTRFFAQLGLMPTVYLKSDQITQVTDFQGNTRTGESKGSNEGIDLNYIQTVVGFGVSQQIGSKIELRATPTYRLFVDGDNLTFSNWPTYYSIGFNISAFVKL